MYSKEQIDWILKHTKVPLLMEADMKKTQEFLDKKEAEIDKFYPSEYRIHSENIIEILNFAYSQRSNMKDPIAHIIMDVIINFKKAVENQSDIYIIYERKTK